MIYTPATLEIGDDDPVRLSDAVDLFFPRGGMSLSALRTEARKGRLVIERIAGKDFVTKRAINDMRARCRDRENRPASTFGETATSESGSFETDNAMSAQDALRSRLSRPSENSRTTSRTVSEPTRRNVVRLPSASERS